MSSVIVHSVKTSLIGGAQWFAVLRIALGLWWFKSFWHKDKKAWIQRNAGIAWAADVAAKHKWGFVTKGFESIVKPRPKVMTYVILGSELALGLGLIVGLLTPIALVASALLSVIYLVLMIHDWAEQGQNFMMFAAAVVLLGAHGWQAWSLDHVIKLFS